MRYKLASMVKGKRRKSITFRPVNLPATMASDLFAAAYAPVIAAWTEAGGSIVAAYESALSELTTDSPEQVGTRLDGVEATIARIVLSLRLRLERWAVRVETVHRGKWRAAAMNATGVDIGTMIGPADMKIPVGAAIERNVSLVKSVSEQTRTRIAQAVFSGLQRRAQAREVAKEITEAVGMARRRSMNIAADQLVKINAQLNSERRREAGIDTWEWVSSHKVNYRPEHAARDGKRYADGDAPSDLPGELPYCGCTERAVLSLDDPY